jgi:hypothetical protein
MSTSWKERFQEAYKNNQEAHEKRLDTNHTDPADAKRYYRKMGVVIFLVGFLPAAFTVALIIFEGVIYYFTATLAIACWILGLVQMFTGKPKR